jgi:8-oxo-dGTP pyrophosphatase MutT (NUDIX family)
MTNPIKAAVLCPWIVHNDNLMVLMIRRSFWNKEKDRPMAFPGEWAFAGGKYESQDKNLVDTAVREFREELGYTGLIDHINLIRFASSRFGGRNHHVEFYSANVDPISYFSYEFERELIDDKWIKPSDAIELIQSKEFDKEQNYWIKRYGLDQPVHGKYAIDSRQSADQTIITLEHFVKNDKMYTGETK